ncbi:hypothetical protein [Aquimarina pacifica]|nr:hypothetical protein [Aquimarina pacifica]
MKKNKTKKPTGKLGLEKWKVVKISNTRAIKGGGLSSVRGCVTQP